MTSDGLAVKCVAALLQLLISSKGVLLFVRHRVRLGRSSRSRYVVDTECDALLRWIVSAHFRCRTDNVTLFYSSLTFNLTHDTGKACSHPFGISLVVLECPGPYEAVDINHHVLWCRSSPLASIDTLFLIVDSRSCECALHFMGRQTKWLVFDNEPIRFEMDRRQDWYRTTSHHGITSLDGLFHGVDRGTISTNLHHQG